MALDLREQDDYRAYIAAGGEPKKFKWASSDHAGMNSGESVAETIIREVQRRKGFSSGKRDVWEYGEVVGFKKITKAEKWQEPDKPGGKGVFLGHVWVDEEGKEVDTSGYVIIESQHGEAKAFSKKVRERLH